jgi:hypothetical protein
MELNIDQLSSLLQTAARLGASRAMEEAGVTKGTVTLAWVKLHFNDEIAYEARYSSLIDWTPIGKGGKTSGVYCNKEEFDRFAYERKFEFKSKK